MIRAVDLVKIYQDVQTIGKLKYKTFKRYTQDLDEIKRRVVNNKKWIEIPLSPVSSIFYGGVLTPPIIDYIPGKRISPNPILLFSCSTASRSISVYSIPWISGAAKSWLELKV